MYILYYNRHCVAKEATNYLAKMPIDCALRNLSVITITRLSCNCCNVLTRTNEQQPHTARLWLAPRCPIPARSHARWSHGVATQTRLATHRHSALIHR